jgi:hypothetical protein
MKKLISFLSLGFLLFLMPLSSLSSPATASASTQTTTTTSTTGSGIDCNGYSSSGATNLSNLICADPVAHYDNGWYVGHDEPSLQFFSSTAGSANNMAWSITLPAADPTPTQSGSVTANFENYVAFWFAAAICDPNSYPFGACTANSDGNAPGKAGSALLELQFYPPGWQPFSTQISCNHTQWCAALNIDSLSLNNACFEPVNFAFLQDNGVPPGPPGPGLQTLATFTPNAHTVFMNPGDQITVTVKDTASGLETIISDITTGATGFMVASGANGFMNTNSATCATSPFSFHPEYSTAKAGNIVPWTALFANVNFAVETGHFQLGTASDSDDSPCFPGPTVAGCVSANTEFDGTSYVPDWADGTAAHPSSFVLSPPLTLSSGTYSSSPSSFLFATDVPASEATSTGSGTTCNFTTGAGCVVPPETANGQSTFYPFYSSMLGPPNTACNFLFGNDITGLTFNDYGKDAQYGSVNPLFGGTWTSAMHPLPTNCAVAKMGIPQFPLPTLLIAALSFLGLAIFLRLRRNNPLSRGI